MSFAADLKARIAAEGGMSVADYIEASNAHYYASRDPLGKGGDFTTAPEISQMFGEMVGACLADVFLRAGGNGDAIYAELGPGRGTLATDALRLLRGVGLKGPPHFVETSAALRAEQEKRHPTARWHDRIDQLPPRPTLCVTNEFFDALPVRQWVGEKERRVVLNEAGALAFAPEGEVTREDSPAITQAAGALGDHLARHGGVALVIDYGYAGGEQRDTLQAVKRHEKVDPLSAPGEADLTTHVDFVALAAAAQAAGARTSRVFSQGTFLETLGLGPRAMTLAGQNPERAEEIAGQRRRLSGEEEMGTLFKVMAIHHRGWPVPAGLGQ
ncbi:class I SAM-dependent methyltransferase [Sphingomicrobium arenosum]|uniref:class I SAM-dependent methyltransferase n=1 Tax=Sphingomicrobium arenosum TaxID=2233861 RepID=UPI002240FC44|nr:SAM-dependent methyltransferase [Sphingomicrobium arenosum]